MSTHASNADPLGLIGRTLEDRYEIESLVDEGGFGYVYRARRVMWDKPVAVKLYKQREIEPKKQEQQLKAFIAEGKLLSELSRKTTAIVQSFDIGTYAQPDGTKLVYMALEWLDGRTLADVMAAQRGSGSVERWDLRRVMATLEPVAVALSVAHASGVAHRDVKPANIFLVEEAGSSNAIKLLDFGIAKVALDLQEGFESTGADVGPYTPKYAAPEQITKRHGATGPWSDVYALALIAVELLLGRYPLDAQGFGQLVLAVCDPAARPTPRAHGLDVSDDVERVFQRALAVSVDERYREAGAFWAALTEAAPMSAPGQFTLRARRSIVPGSDPNLLDEATQSARTVPRPPPPRRPRWPLLAAAVGAAAIGTYFGLRALTGAAPPLIEASGPAGAPAPKPANSRIDRERLASFAALPETVTSPDNPRTPEKVELGRALFFDKRLSKGRDVSCATCHVLDAYGVDGKRVSAGHEGQLGTRNTLSVYNAAGAFALNWDGAAVSVEAQARLPLTNPKEMAMTPEDVVAVLKSIPGYVKAFAAVFGDKPQPAFEDVIAAIGAFERQLLTPSRWDAYLNGKESALSDKEKAGFNDFVEVGCPTCHYGPYLGLTMYQKLGLVKPWPDMKDPGRYEVTKQTADVMVFRVPSLRNVSKTGPYFHDGSMTSLAESVRMMARHQLGKELDEGQVDRVTAFLDALTGAIPVEQARVPALPPDGP
jgi:cytochrome c peroxidase/serine/threonine protein kinase